MSLKPPTPGLRRLFNGSNSTVRVEILVPAGDTLEVSDAVAEQLAVRGEFKEAAAEPRSVEDAPKPAKKAAARKSGETA